MLIRFGVIPAERLPDATTLAAELGASVTRGDMLETDKLSAALAALVVEPVVTMTEEQWSDLLRRAREINPSWQADYLLSPDRCAVLEAQLADTGFAPLTEVLGKAASSSLHVLQLPVAEE